MSNSSSYTFQTKGVLENKPFNGSAIEVMIDKGCHGMQTHLSFSRIIIFGKQRHTKFNGNAIEQIIENRSIVEFWNQWVTI